MYKLFLVVLFFSQILLAESVVKIDTNSVNITNFQMGYFIDKSQELTLTDIYTKKFTLSENRLSLGTDADVTWAKVSIKNETNSTKKLYIHNAVTYFSADTRFYEVKDNILLKSIRFEPINHYNTDKMKGAEAVFSFTLAPQEKKSIYLRSNFLAYQLIDLGIFDADHSLENLMNKFIPIIILISILATLVSYYFVLFIFSRHKEYIYYSLYLITATLYLSYAYGALSHYYHLHGEWALRLMSLIILFPVFLSLFVKAVFDTPQDYKKENRYLNSIIIIFGVLYLYSFVDYYKASELTSLIYLYFLVVMLSIGISIYKKGNPLAKYFLIAHVTYIVFSLIAILFYNSLLKYTLLTSHAMAIGILLEAFLLGGLVSYRIKLLEEDNLEKEALILTDAMTGLYNKHYFTEYFDKQLHIQHRLQKNLVLMIIDVDYFKQYNDHYGHLSGDHALITIAKEIRKSLQKPNDMTFRIGGEEFAVICMSNSLQEAIQLAETIRQNVCNTQVEHSISAICEHVTVSIGLHLVKPEDESKAETVYQLADQALYQAKKEGRNRVVVR